jgi:hypothetical protein
MYQPFTALCFGSPPRRQPGSIGSTLARHAQTGPMPFMGAGVPEFHPSRDV